MSRAYSAMVRSLENFPLRATFSAAAVAHQARSPYRASTFRWVSTYPVRSARWR
jgi:cob(I)alamin adenosyltransferase